MTIASLLLALITVANGPDANGAHDPILLDFHAEWCGPCQKMRPVLKQFVRSGYPVKSVDIDRATDLAKRYDVTAVPTFIVIDRSGRELARTSGLQPLGELERFYRMAAAKASPPQNSNAHTGSNDNAETDSQDAGDTRTSDDEPPIRRASRRVEPADRSEEEADRSPAPVAVNPHPWETTVRIKVLAKNSIGFGSGTIIHSTPEESLILTCAHVFKIEGRAKQFPPKQFPREIKIDLFDGKLRGQRPAQVHFLETVDGEAVDYDFVHDVGLIRIRPGRRLPASRVAPAYWEPKRTMRMLTVGCSEGQDATAWHTIIRDARMSGSLIGSPAYEAIECEQAPKQGRSGGGLFTDNGYIAGVCNFAEPRGNVGLYATPRSIYRLLDRNQLASLYAPVSQDGGTLLADAPARTRPPAVRLQSPGPDETEPSPKLASEGQLMIPPPELIGVPELVGSTAAQKSRPGSSRTTARRVAWMPKPDEPARSELQTDLSLDPSADNDHFGSSPKPTADTDQPHANTEDVGNARSPGTSSASETKPHWHAVPSATEIKSTDAKSGD